MLKPLARIAETDLAAYRARFVNRDDVFGRQWDDGGGWVRVPAPLIDDILRAHLRGEPPLDASEMTLRLGTADAVTGAVRTAERLSNAHWTMVYLLQNPDWTGEGVVVEQKPGRDVVLIPALAIETELYGRRPRTLNSTVRLAVESVDLPQRTARFRAE